MTHNFHIVAGDFDCTGEVATNLGGTLYYVYDEKSPRPSSHLDEALGEILYNIGKFLQANGSLKYFEVVSQ